MTRILTALVLIPTISYFVVWAHPWAFAAVLAAVGLLCYREFNTIAAAHGFEAPGWIGYPLGLLILLAPHLEWWTAPVAIFCLAYALTTKDLKDALPRGAALIAGVFYIFGSWRCAIGLREISPWWLFFALALNWVGDAAAMYVGRAFGRHKLAPRVSPGKSWEGSAASVVASLAFGFLLFPRVLPETPWWMIAALGLLGNVAGQVGDLAESALKRGAGLKDSGSSLPGHGGWLDRVDSSLFAVPAVYLAKQLLTLL
jgi:phosphatidate cytidylyltransferase